MRRRRLEINPRPREILRAASGRAAGAVPLFLPRLHETSVEAAALNDAYRTLKDPLSRAVYLAGLRGVDLPGDGKTIDDPDLLTEVMDAREELQEASSVGEVDALAKFAREDLEKGLAGLARLFQANDKKAIRKALLRLRYLDKFAEEARARRANLK